jgi:hypothetical protein
MILRYNPCHHTMKARASESMPPGLWVLVRDYVYAKRMTNQKCQIEIEQVHCVPPLQSTSIFHHPYLVSSDLVNSTVDVLTPFWLLC